MTLNIVSSFNGVSDPDAAAYIEAVEAASGNFGATVAGGGSNNVPVFSDGTNWLIG